MSKTGFQIKEATDSRQLPYYLTLVVPTMFGWEYEAFLLLRKMLPQLREVSTGKVGAAYGQELTLADSQPFLLWARSFSGFYTQEFLLSGQNALTFRTRRANNHNSELE